MLTAAEGGGPLAGLGSRVGPVRLGVRELGLGMELAVTLIVPRRGVLQQKGCGEWGRDCSDHRERQQVLKGSALQEGA